MKTIKLATIICGIILIACGQRSIEASRLEKRSGLYYHVNEDKPYTGKVYYTYENGQKQEEASIKNGRQEGVWREWWDNGQLKQEVNYKNGEKDGPLVSWYPKGQKWYENNYVNGKLEGLYTSWHENGQKAHQSHYKNDKMEGLFTEWNEDGRKINERIMENGIEISRKDY